MSLSLPAGVTLTKVSELDGVRVETDDCVGELVLQGAHVTRWRPDGADPVLFVSEQSSFAPGKPVRGGIPLCGPWFGPGRGGNRTPMHGFYRLAPWRLVAAEEVPTGVRLTLELGGADLSGDDMAAGWPADAGLRFEVTFGRTLTLALTTRTGIDGVDLEEALHTYFVVGDVRRASVEGLDGAAYTDKLDGGVTRTQAGPVTFTGETDRVYATAAATTIVDPALKRRIHIDPVHAASTVVWNPWAGKAAAMADFADDEWTGMLCVETANALDAGAVVIPPDSEHTISATISVE